MKKLVFIMLVALMMCCTSSLWAYVLTFDDIPIGTDLAYYPSQYGEHFGVWTVATSAEIPWAEPHSGSNIVTWTGGPATAAALWFGYSDGENVTTIPVRSVGAYFCTDSGAVVRMVGYSHSPWRAVASVVIGASGQSWSNRYIEVSSEANDIAWVVFEQVGSTDSRHNFSMDDMTVTPVPEPSSLVALGVGGVGILGAAWRRRR